MSALNPHSKGDHTGQSAQPSYYIAHGVPTRHHRRRIKTEKKAKVVAAGGDVLECRTNHLAFSSKDDLKKSFGRTSILGGGGSL